MYFIGQIIATLVILCWIAQGWHLTSRTWNGGYAPLWSLFILFFTVVLVLPLALIWW